MNRKSRFLFVSILTLVIVSFPFTAFAGESNGSSAVSSSGTKSFITYSKIVTNQSAYAYQYVSSRSQTVAGEIGAIARLYRSSGVLYSASGWRYTGSTWGPNNWMIVNSNVRSSGTSWYSHGSGACWFSGSYHTFTGGRTLNQTTY